MSKNETKLPRIVTQDEWLVSRKELLAKEKEATRMQDVLNTERRRLPMVEISKKYIFEDQKGKASLLDLFEGRRQLIIHHFMFDPSWYKGCSSCTFFEDDGVIFSQLHISST